GRGRAELESSRGIAGGRDLHLAVPSLREAREGGLDSLPFRGGEAENPSAHADPGLQVDDETFGPRFAEDDVLAERREAFLPSGEKDRQGRAGEACSG